MVKKNNKLKIDGNSEQKNMGNLLLFKKNMDNL